MIQWSDNYLIGIPVIDEQHKKLFLIANEASELLSLPSHTDKYDDIIAIIEELRDYTEFHFQSEEKILTAIKYPKLFSHKVEHADFIEKINKIDLYSVDEDQDTYLLDIVNFIIDWIAQHIIILDPEWAKCYKEFYQK